MAELIHQRRGMWEDIGFKEPSSLDEADMDYRKWAKVQLKTGTLLGWIVETPDHVVAGGGCVWLRPEQPRPNLPELIEPYLLSMFTEPEFRKRGAASKIVEAAIKWCRRNGYRRILLHASKKGRGLYRKYGFTRTWEMRLELTNSGGAMHTHKKARRRYSGRTHHFDGINRKQGRTQTVSGSGIR